MSRSLIHSIYIELPNSLQDRVIEEYKKVSNKFKDLRTHEFKMHISIYSAFIDENSTEEFIKIAHECLSRTKFKIKFSNYSTTDNGRGSGYIFIGLDPSSSQEVINLNSLAKEVMKELEIDSFRDYDFKPHLSLTKLVDKDIDSAYNLLEGEGILGENFEVDELVLSGKKTQTNGLASFLLLANLV